MDYVELITAALDGENACGENLDDDASFQNFFFEAEGTPERYDGQSTIPAEHPDWRAVKKNALNFLNTTKDLKLISVLSQAVLNTENIIAFEQCLDGLNQLVNTQWQTLYPALDEDDGDPLERISALGHLVDSNFIVNVLKDTAIVQTKVFGKVSLRIIDKASDNSTNKEEGDLDFPQIKASFKEAEQEDILTNYQAIQKCLDHLAQINNTFIEQCGNEYSVNFDVVCECLTNIANALEKFTDVANTAKTIEPSIAKTDDSQQVKTNTTAVEHHQSITSTDYKLTSREEVERCFDMICTYYQEYEPSSPIPILINRSKKLIHMDFIDIVKEILPDALDQITKLGGITKEDQVEESASQSSGSSW